jgi:hypothetical protein
LRKCIDTRKNYEKNKKGHPRENPFSDKYPNGAGNLLSEVLGFAMLGLVSTASFRSAGDILVGI